MEFLRRLIGFWVGDGRKIRFWHDTWYADSNLASLFLELYQIVSHKNANVNEYVEVINGRVHWNATLVRSA